MCLVKNDCFITIVLLMPRATMYTYGEEGIISSTPRRLYRLIALLLNNLRDYYETIWLFRCKIEKFALG